MVTLKIKEKGYISSPIFLFQLNSTKYNFMKIANFTRVAVETPRSILTK
nr:MAG TPA: hypothetical protein [Caudoviricetes sp.]